MWFGLEKTLFIPMKSYGESSWPPSFTHHSEHSSSAWRSENQPIEEEEKCWQNNKRRAECDENSNTQEAACTWNVCFVCGAWAKKKHELGMCVSVTQEEAWTCTFRMSSPLIFDHLKCCITKQQRHNLHISRLKTLKSWWETRTTATK